MNSMTIQVENPSILASLKTILSAIDGVRIVKSTTSTAIQEGHEPNDITLSAMKEVEEGKTFGNVDLSSIDGFIASMQ